MKQNVLNNAFTDKSVCWRCKYEHDDKNECIDNCPRLAAYQKGQPYSHIPHYEKVEPALSEGVPEVEIMEQKESDTIPVPIKEEKRAPLTPFGIRIKKGQGECLLCERPAKRRDLCLKHYQRWRQGLDTHPVLGGWTKMTQKEINEARGFVFDECLIENCHEIGDRRGLCQHDYRKWQRGYITHPELGAFFPKGKRTKAKKIVAEKTLNHGISDEALRNVGPSLEAAVKRIEGRKEMDFNDIVEHRIEQIRTVLTQKAKEYASEQDRFHNFNRAGEILGISPERALVGMMVKHFVSVLDLVENSEKHPEKLNDAIIDEKIGDLCNYLILLEGLLKKRINKK